MLCEICEQFRMERGFIINGRRVCRTCVDTLAELAGLKPKSDIDDFDNAYAAIEAARDELSAARHALEDIRRDARKVRTA